MDRHRHRHRQRSHRNFLRAPHLRSRIHAARQHSPIATAPLPEADPLVAEARALSEPWDLATPDDFAFAEDWPKRAVALDPTDGAAAAASPVVAGGTRVMLDPSETWSPAARSRAEKAIKLAPKEPRARFTWSFSLRFDPQPRDEAVRA